jgi:hypothetical protein
LVRLAVSGNLDQPGGDLGTQSRSNCGAGRTPCFVAVEQQDDFFEVVLKEPLLMLAEGATHEGDNARQTRLMNSETVEEAFDNHNGLAVKLGPVQIEENQRFAKPGRETMSRFGCPKRSPCVSDKSAILTMNGYHNAPFHVPSSLKETNSEVLRCFGTDSPLRKIGMADINVRRCERKRRIALRVDRRT